MTEALPALAVAEAIRRATEGEELAPSLVEGAMEEILAGAAEDAAIAGLAMALRTKGETAGELAAAARVMRRRCTVVDAGLPPGEPLVDTCGTGGDSAGTFNVSTVAAFVVAACGVKVAKHGNRAVSSRSGSADVLEALGARLDPPSEVIARSIRELGIGFLFAPVHHAALRHAARARRELGVRTFFNLLGPLSSPAGATHQLVGVYDGARVRALAEVLGLLGVRGAWVVHGEGGLDEISPLGETRVAVLEGGSVEERTIAPEDFGSARAGPESLAGGSAAENAALARRILAGAAVPQRVAVRLNAAGALLAAGRFRDPREAGARVDDVLGSGDALRLLDAFVERTRSEP